MSDNTTYVIKELLAERGLEADIPDNEAERFMLYRSLVNTRSPAPASDEYLKAEDDLLHLMTVRKGVTDAASLRPAEPHIFLWRGDITTLACDAIVNAANSGMTGCYRPCHSCIDNCIHTFAGVRLRLECDRIMREQGHEEPTGCAKITPAYDLPCKYVIHTVGPIVQGGLTDEHRRLLAGCYESCLELAEKNGVKSIAFCCISTGVFGYPQRDAAETAVAVVRRYIGNGGGMDVIFNVFTSEDLEIYRSILEI